jgi:CRP/FNR family cyclic AMP-dependent transcriptional regulator
MSDLPTRPLVGSCLDCPARGFRLFCNLDADALRALDEIGTQIKLPGRAIVFNEHDPAAAVYVVCEGQLKLSAMARDGRVMILRLAEAGDLLGLSAALNHTGHEVTAETLGPVLLKSIPAEAFAGFLHTFTEVGEKTAQVMAKEYREVFLDARRLALSGSAGGRLARLLLEWGRRATCGKARETLNTTEELRFTMALTHEELASMTGTSRETVTRLLKKFETEKLIVRKGASLRILAPERLDLLAH